MDHAPWSVLLLEELQRILQRHLGILVDHGDGGRGATSARQPGVIENYRERAITPERFLAISESSTIPRMGWEGRPFWGRILRAVEPLREANQFIDARNALADCCFR